MRPLKIFGWAVDHGGCGNYRLGLPMWALRQLGHDAVAFTELNVEVPDDLDILVGQLVTKQAPAARWRAMATDPGRSFGMVYEIDDDIWNVHPDNPAYTYYDAETQRYAIESIEVADAVTVTTEHLADVVRKYNPNVAVLPNCFDATLLSHERPRADRLTVGWAGGSSHADDFASVEKELRSFFRNHPEVSAHFIGVNYGPAVGRPDARHTPWMTNLVDYIKGLDLDIGIAPLAYNVFNRSKSDLKVLEYASVGIPVVASDYGPYAGSVEHGVTGLLVKHPHEMVKHLRTLVNDRDMRAELSRQARTWAATRTIQGNVWRWEDAYNSLLGRSTRGPSVGEPSVPPAVEVVEATSASPGGRAAGGADHGPALDAEAFVALDRRTPKDDRSWAFPVCAYDLMLTGNDRAVFEAVKDDASIRKVVLTRGRAVDVDGVNVEVVPMDSRAGQQLLAESRYVFVKHSPSVNVPHPLDATSHRVVNLWHGIPLKRIGVTSLDNQDRLEWTIAEHERCHAVIASSRMDRLAMAAAFAPLQLDDMWLTGLPRNDVIVRDEALLPADFRRQLERLRATLAGRRLVLFAPTFRNAQGEGQYRFTTAELLVLRATLEAHGAVLGIREHMADTGQTYTDQLLGRGLPAVSLGRHDFPETELLYREAALLVTDYSSCFADFMLTGKPEICFAYDLEQYAGTERGLFYNIEDVFPGPVCTDFPALMVALTRALQGDEIEPAAVYAHKRRMLFEYTDDRSSERLVERIMQEVAA